MVSSVVCNPHRSEGYARTEMGIAKARVFPGRPVSQGAVRAVFIVFLSPFLKDRARLREAAEQLSVHAFVSQLVVKAFDICLFPWRSRFDVHRPDRVTFEPVLDVIRDELRAVIRANVLWPSVDADGLFQRCNDISSSQRPAGSYR